MSIRLIRENPRLDLESEILREHSKRQALRISAWIGADKGRFRELMNLFLRGDYRVTQRSAWIVSHCADRHPFLIGPWLKPMVKRMKERGVHDAVRRNGMRILQNIEIPHPLMGTVASLCFEYLESVEAPIAVKANSMTVLANIARREPDMVRELQAIVEQMMPYVGAALRSRGRQILKTLSSLQHR